MKVAYVFATDMAATFRLNTMILPVRTVRG